MYKRRRRKEYQENMRNKERWKLILRLRKEGTGNCSCETRE